ncbi:MAG: putative flippase GtrA [Planctomycetota bacterium]|jgi:putative flippase GtrA
MSSIAGALRSRQFVTFVAVGVACALVDIGLLHFLSQTGMQIVAATTIGFGAGLLLNFALHLRVTFATTLSRKTLWRYLAVVAINYCITLLFVTLSCELLASPLPGKIASLPVIAVNGFLLSKHWVFN